jgi:hypothetical protein
MEAKHRIAIPRILGTDVKDGVARGDIDGRQEDGLAASFTSPLYHIGAVLRELLAIQMAMRVNKRMR